MPGYGCWVRWGEKGGQRMKYVPVLRFRDQERLVLKNITLSQKTMPLIEIVKPSPNGNLKGTFGEIYQSELNHISVPFMIDFPTHLNTSKTEAAIQNFLRPLQVNQQAKNNALLSLSHIHNVIPVISYNPVVPYQPNSIVNDATLLRKTYRRLAFRVFDRNINSIINDIERIITTHDILVFDIDDAPHGSPALQTKYQRILQVKQNKNCQTVVTRSAIPSNIYNTGLIDDTPITSIDNSLLTAYLGYHFDAFGDFAGLKNDLPSTGGTISPGLIFYSWHTNTFVGYKGRTKNLSEFQTHIGPMLINSTYWGNYSQSHHQNCPGCKKIQAIVSRQITSGNQATWKGITLAHYLYTMEEFL